MRKKMLITIAIIITGIVISGILFFKLNPEFGGSLSNTQKQQFEMLPHFQNGKFLNKEKINMEMGFRKGGSLLMKMLKPEPHITPEQDIKVVKMKQEGMNNNSDSTTRISWLGHSSFFIEMDGKHILLDPVFSKATGPHLWVGRKKYNSQMPVKIEELPEIDAVFISHDHYDHLDYFSILKLKEKTKRFFVPLGVGNHLLRWGVKKESIKEMDWWQEDNLGAISIAFTPTRHMSGRGFTDQSSTLWGSWVIQGSAKKIYFSGDGGYGGHFKEIGNKYGPFDIGLMECGQYNKHWAHVHMMPEESVQAGIDLQAKMIIPIHWGSYTLALHRWTEPVERITRKAKEMNLKIATPRIGELFLIGESDLPVSKWWENYLKPSVHETL